MTARVDYRPGFIRRPRVTDWLTFLTVGGVTLVGLGMMLLLPTQPFVGLAPLIGFAGAAVLWQRPILSVLTLFSMTTMIEVFPMHFADSFTDNIPLWRNLSTIGLPGVPVSPAELLMAVGLFVWFVRGLFSQTLKIETGPLLGSYRWYILAVIVAGVHGKMLGGSTNIVLWEMRFGFYALIAHFMAMNMFRSRQDIDVLGWIIILGTGIKGLQGTWRYLVTFRGVFEGNEILEHDEALFFPAYYIFVLLLHIFGGSSRQKKIGLYLLPFVMIADVANKRRASTAGIVIALIVLIVMLYQIVAKHRLKILRISLGAIVFLSLYTAAFWNSNSRLGQPVQAIKSQITPSNRDEDSDRYRELENESLMRGVRRNAIFGQGYSIELELLPGMVDVRESSPLMLILPHNSILWVWYRTGLVGFVLFWMVMGFAIIYTCFLARTETDPYIRRWAFFAVVVTVIHLLIGWADQGLHGFRQIVYVWVLLAIPQVLVRLNKEKNVR